MFATDDTRPQFVDGHNLNTTTTEQYRKNFVDCFRAAPRIAPHSLELLDALLSSQRYRSQSSSLRSLLLLQLTLRKIVMLSNELRRLMLLESVESRAPLLIERVRARVVAFDHLVHLSECGSQWHLNVNRRWHLNDLECSASLVH